ncbi:hypothetical protein [Rhodopirellula bahusiensis]|uniref:Uncharacterized protein n=1 Tax=Rhodopirellula bahusiensis TaxID=2014065 RepID=A0A2G1VYV5_9BACT|nr:hypothetical protein [Rhodopirellula bahusiensis]PHQ31790.1 hypothetical protein CEE69_29270 [Rhodopirellula bahusiensis]
MSKLAAWLVERNVMRTWQSKSIRSEAAQVGWSRGPMDCRAVARYCGVNKLENDTRVLNPHEAMVLDHWIGC